MQEARTQDGTPMRAGSFLVTWKPGTSDLDKATSRWLGMASAFELIGLPNTERLEVPAFLARIAEPLLRSLPNVARVEPDLMVYTTATPNDPSYGAQWGMNKIGMPSAWDRTTGSLDVRVAVLDCGIFEGHPDLQGKVVGRANFSSSQSSFNDNCNHGTHVAGIVAANTNNGVGVAGVGHRTRLVNVKVLNDQSSGSYSGVIEGILWTAGCEPSGLCGQRRAEIINLSLGGSANCSSSGLNPGGMTLQAAINRAWDQGILIVAAAGNNGVSTSFVPAACENVIAVGASTSNDNKASFSNYGSWVDVAAPGASILSTVRTGSYDGMSGTSMASPHVAGLAALVWARGYSTNQLAQDRIFSTVNSRYKAGSQRGRINAAAAVSTAGPLPLGTTTPTPVAGSPTPTFTPTNTPTATNTPLPTNTPGPANTPAPTSTPGAVTSTGYRACSANVAVSGGDGNGFETTPANACADGGGRALDTNSGTSRTGGWATSYKDRHVFYGFGLTVPSSATIRGIQVRADGWADSTTDSPAFSVDLSWDGGATWTTASSASLTTSERTYTLGSPTDTWGRTWTPAQVNGNNLRVRLTMSAGSTARDFSLDYIAVNVTYAP